jgi:predicted RNA-binding protein
MLFEIQKMEGLGRLGIINFSNPVETPTLICLQERYSDKFSSGITKSVNNALGKEYSFIFSKNQNKECFQVSDNILASESFPRCYLYSSLQMQGKSKEEFSHILDFFPEKYHTALEYNDAFHIIPWDLPDIFLDHYLNYLDTITSLTQKDQNIPSNLVINVPFSTDLVSSLPKILSHEIAVICLGDISSLLNHPIFLLDYIQSISEKISPHCLIYAPSVPSLYFPILSYLGIDLFDLTFLSATKNTNQIDNSVLEYENTVESYTKTIQQVKQAIKSGKLRDLVRVYANSYPPLKSLLRQIDKNERIEQRTPIFGSKTLYCTDETDFSRPEVRRFRNRVSTRYTLSPKIQGVIFLPCSARKPYSLSKSHQYFRGTIHRTLKSKRHSISEVILTSPLGVVPRELEYTFPAAHYDIPVTGEWSRKEEENLKEDLRSFIMKCSESITLVGYVKGAEKRILQQVGDELNREIHFIDSESTSLTSKESLQNFKDLLLQKLKTIQRSEFNPNLQFLRAIADYQFGKGVGIRLIPDDVKIIGRRELGLRIRHKNIHYLTFRPSIGLLTLSIEAAKTLRGYAENIVIYDGIEIQGSTLFANAISEASLNIRINDEVIVVNKQNEIIAVGQAYLPGELLMKMNRGPGVKLRKKVK